MSCYLIFGNLRNRVWSDAYNAPKITDETTAGTSLELPKIWDSLIEQHSSNARVLSQDEFLKEFGGDKK